MHGFILINLLRARGGEHANLFHFASKSVTYVTGRGIDDGAAHSVPHPTPDSIRACL